VEWLADEGHVPLSSPDANYGRLEPTLDLLGVPPARHLVPGFSRSVEESAATYGARLAGLVAAGAEFDLGILGANGIVAGGIQSPTITNRRAQTSLVVQNATTIVIGGLIGQESTKTVSGIPFLSSIPLLGFFFSDTKNSKVKAELIIVITPHVVTNISEAEIISQDFRDKVDQIKKLIKKSDEKWLKNYQIENGEKLPAAADKD